jgi:hypothetical protein
VLKRKLLKEPKRKSASLSRRRKRRNLLGFLMKVTT